MPHVKHRGYAVGQERASQSPADEWREVTLGQVIELKRGYDLPQRERISGPIPLVSSSGVTDYHVEAKVRGPGVITGRYGTLGKVFFVPDDFWPLNTTLYVRDFKGNDPRFIAYFLRSLDFSAYSDKAAVPGLNRNHLHEASVRIPPVPEQRAIAHILGTLDDKIELNRRMNQTLEEMARALFKSWFVDFDPVRAKATLTHAGGHDAVADGEPSENGAASAGEWTVNRARASLARLDPQIADLFPDRLVDSELGGIPEGWAVKALEDCIDVARGLSYKGSGLSSDGTPMHNLNSLYEGGGYKNDGIKYYNDDYQDRHVTQPGDVLVANTEQGHDRLLIGFAAIVPKHHGDRGVFSHHLYRIEPNKSSGLSADYVCQLLNTQFMHRIVSGYATGTTVNMLPIDALRIPAIVVPPARLVTTLSSVAEAARKKQYSLVMECHSLAAQRGRAAARAAIGKDRERRSVVMDVNVNSRAIEKLIDYTASGIGSTASFVFSRMSARRDAQVKLISATGDARAKIALAESQADHNADNRKSSG